MKFFSSTELEALRELEERPRAIDAPIGGAKEHSAEDPQMTRTGDTLEFTRRVIDRSPLRTVEESREPPLRSKLIPAGHAEELSHGDSLF